MRVTLKTKPLREAMHTTETMRASNLEQVRRISNLEHGAVRIPANVDRPRKGVKVTARPRRSNLSNVACESQQVVEMSAGKKQRAKESGWTRRRREAKLQHGAILFTVSP